MNENRTISRRYDVLLCDADNTIFDFNRAEEIAFAQACDAMGIAANDELLAIYSEINDALWKLFERGGIDQPTLRVRRFEQFLAKIGMDHIDARAMSEAFVTSLGQQAVMIPGAADAVRRWSKIVPVVIVTNGIARVQHGRMDKSEIKGDIAGLVISEEVGAAKPDPRMVLEGMRIAGVSDKSRALMLGDSLTSDIAAAANAGVDACWYNPKGKANAAGLPVRYEIADLDGVDAILLGDIKEGDGA